MMDTPVCDYVKKYADEKNIRLHMPGHKGKCFIGPEALDITEIDGADVLYKAQGIIKKSEENAARLFSTAKTVFSTEGSSLAIRAMLYLIKLYANTVNKRPFIAAGRNAHKTFMTAAALLDFDIAWLYPQKRKSIISCDISSESLDEALKEMPEKPLAVYITSPDYLGNIADIRGISAVCRKYGALLLVDNAHGAYLNFTPKNLHPIYNGADICCDSAHKTLPVLTGGAYLHISAAAPDFFCEQAENALSLFASTSPSYLIIQSLDLANRYIADGYTVKLAEICKAVAELKRRICSFGFATVGDEPLKLTVAPKFYGYTGIQLAEILAEYGIICEFSDPDFTVMMFTVENDELDLECIENAFCGIERRKRINVQPPTPEQPDVIFTLNEAIFAASEELEITKCCGRILASANIACPPAIPIVICGERINESAIECFEYYGISSCRCIKE